MSTSPGRSAIPLATSSAPLSASARVQRSMISVVAHVRVLRDPRVLCELRDELLDRGIRDRLAALADRLVVAEETAAALLPEPALLDQLCDDRRAAERRSARGLRDEVVDVETREVGDRERPHREAERLLHHVVDPRGADALLGELDRDALVLEQHPVADEAERVPGNDRDLAQLLPEREAGEQRLRRGLLAAHDLEQLHDVRRREEVQSEHLVGALRRGGDLVDVERRGVRGEDARRAS